MDPITAWSWISSMETEFICKACGIHAWGLGSEFLCTACLTDLYGNEHEPGVS